MQQSGEYENINAANVLGVRPYCSCCGGGEHRKGYTRTKAKSHDINHKVHEREKQRKQQHADKRNRRAARPDKFGAFA